MKKLLLSALVAFFLISCGKENIDLTGIKIKDNPQETLEYVGKIGTDFPSALDSLKVLKSISSEITPIPLEVLFDGDDRIFYGIVYGGCSNYTDVLDTKGHYYHRTWHLAE